MASWAFLPLIASDRVVGSLVLAYDQPHPFTPAERAVLTSLAGLIAQAMDRARLYDTKHELAHTLQSALPPHTLPSARGLDVAARYLPAGHGMDIGGDFYDLIRHDNTTVTVAIGDVQGHNITAAALMGQVRTAVHAHATAGTPRRGPHPHQPPSARPRPGAVHQLPHRPHRPRTAPRATRHRRTPSTDPAPPGRQHRSAPRKPWSAAGH